MIGTDIKRMLARAVLCLLLWIIADKLTAPAPAGEFEDRAKDVFRGMKKKFLSPNEYRPPARKAETSGVQYRYYVAETTDRWKIVLVRYWMPGRVAPARLPVILCHGFSYNAYFYDLQAPVSLARYLANLGFDVWVVNLRGCGQSSKPVPIASGAEAMVGRIVSKIGKETVPRQGFVSVDPKYLKWNMDDHVDYDIPTILSLVKQETQTPQVAWVGHSMGGNIMLAYLSKYGQDASIGRLVTVGSQVTMPQGQLVIQYLLELVKMREQNLLGNKVRVEEAVQSMNNVFFNENNTDPAIMLALATYGNDLPSIGLGKQYLILAQTGRLYDAKKQFDYSAGIGRIQCPYLIVGGMADQIAPPNVQQYLYANVGSPDRTLLLLGRRYGLRANYGHNDSLVGRPSQQEIFPLLANWLAGNPIGR